MNSAQVSGWTLTDAHAMQTPNSPAKGKNKTNQTNKKKQNWDFSCCSPQERECAKVSSAKLIAKIKQYC